MLPFHKAQTTWLTAISSHCLVSPAKDVCVPFNGNTRQNTNQLEINLRRFLAVFLSHNNDQQ